jgi:15-cis-phytoene synthase
VDDRALAASYERCRQLHRRHGRSYYLATRLLPTWKRRHVHALYGFARYADEIVDGGGADPAGRLGEWSQRFLTGLSGEPVDDPLLPAVLHTIERFDLDRADFAAFLAAMAMDLTVARYPTYPDLLAYMAGSAAAIGSMMLPVLEPTDRGAAAEPARQLGHAFQLTNFIRDVAEDLRRGRVYLPMADLDRFGVGVGDLAAPTAGEAVRELVRFEVSRAREHYALASPGIALLPRSSQACVRAAFRLYGCILDEVVRRGYDVLGGRATVPSPRRVAVAAGCLLTPPGRPVRLPGL